MMKLKYLHDNRALAMALLDYWRYDHDGTDIMDYFRISSTAVYPFKYKDDVRYLRFSPKEERTTEAISAELEFIRYLKREGYPVADIVSSNHGKDVEAVHTPWGEYSAAVFKRVSGVQPEGENLKDDMIYDLGTALGKLHQLSRKYEPEHNRRISYQEQLDWMEMVLSNFKDETLAKEEVEVLRNALATLEKTEDNFGLIHYDFELDNLFFDEASNTFNVIDFDDSVYHWYVMDMVQAVESITEDLPDERKAYSEALFVKGYESVCTVDDALLEKAYIFERYANLYGYVRCLRSVSEPLGDQPEWMINLQNNIKRSMQRRSGQFGEMLNLTEFVTK